MPHQTAPVTPRQKAAAKAAKARKLLQGSNVQDSSDEDEDDQPWEWIYDKSSKGKEEVEGSDEESADEDDTLKTPRKRKARNVKTYVGRRIIGARKGKFTCRVGDTVLVRSEGSQTWVAMIWRFCEVEEEDSGVMVKGAEFMCTLCYTILMCLANWEKGSMTRKKYIQQSKIKSAPISFQYVLCFRFIEDHVLMLSERNVLDTRRGQE